MSEHRIVFKYRNHHGKESVRTVDIDSIEFHFHPGFGYQPGWFISGYDIDKKARRSFALSHIVFDEHHRSVTKPTQFTLLHL